MSRRSHFAVAVCAVLAVGAWARQAAADVVHLKDGKKVEGKIVSDTPAAIEVETKFGKLKIERNQIARIEAKRMPAEEFKARLEAAGKDAAKLWSVALFAKENRMKDDYERLVKKVLEADPQHREANEAVGNVLYEGRWYTPEALEKEKAAFAKRMTDDGMVFYNGRWIPADSAKREQGLEQYEGEWIPNAEIYKRKSAKLMPELLGVSLKTYESEHFQVRLENDDALGADVTTLLEDAFAEFVTVFKPNELEARLMTFYPTVVYVLPDSGTVTKFVEPGGYMDQLYNSPKGINERYLDATSFPVFFPRPLIVTSIGRHLKGSDSWTVSLMGFLSHYEGNMLIRRFTRNHPIPGWLEAGMASYFEARLNGFQTLSITEYTGYEHIKKWEQGLETFPEWFKKMSDAQFRASLPPIADLRKKMVEEVNSRELVKSFFLVTWLMKTKPDALANYARHVYERIETTRNEQRTEESVFAESFGMTPEQMDAEFEEWAKAIPPIPKLD